MPKSKGFTFVELVIVMAIIAILAAIAIPNFLEARTRSVVSRSKAELAVLKSAIGTYRLEQKVYPSNVVAGQLDSQSLLVLTTPIPYLSLLPWDAMTTEEARGQHHTGGVATQPYRYYNALQVDPKAGLKLADPKLKAIWPGFCAGFITGYGPASALPSNPPPPYTSIAQDGTATMLTYDPTNGTTSPGDLYMTFP